MWGREGVLYYIFCIFCRLEIIFPPFELLETIAHLVRDDIDIINQEIVKEDLMDYPSNDTSEERTPVPSPHIFQTENMDSIFSETTTERSSNDLIISKSRALKLPVTRSQSLDSPSQDIRPSLLQRAQLFIQKQLDGLAFSQMSNSGSASDSEMSKKALTSTSSHPIISISPNLPSPNSPLPVAAFPHTLISGRVEELSPKSNSANSSQNASPVQSLKNEKTSLSTCTSLSSVNIQVQGQTHQQKTMSTTNLPPINSRHISPNDQRKPRSPKDISPYRQMPNVVRGYNQNTSSASSIGHCSNNSE